MAGWITDALDEWERDREARNRVDPAETHRHPRDDCYLGLGETCDGCEWFDDGATNEED